MAKLENEVVNSLPTGQKYLYRISRAVASGIFSDDMKDIQIGPYSHARWVNLASRLLKIWCSEHGLERQDLKILKLLAEFTMGVYSVEWFEIKVIFLV